jgi:hypothetical protein
MQTLLRASSWMLGLLIGVPFAIAVFVGIKLSRDSTTAALISGAGGGLLVGATVALAWRKPRGEMRQILESLPVDDWRAARTATWRGPVPTRPDVRATALQLVDLRLNKLGRIRKWAVIVFGLNLVLAVANVVMGRWWYVVFAVGWAAMLVEQWYAPRRLERRRQLLSAE